MKILVLSDLHLEFHRDHGAGLIQQLDASGVDLLILAGDISSQRLLPAALEGFARKYPRILYVHGNHEFYKGTRKQVIDWTQQVVREYPHVTWLDCNEVTIEGQRFLGTPLWFPEAPLAPKHQISDFSLIRDYESWVYRENSRAVRWLNENLEASDIVITHHLPTQRSVHPKYQSSPLNPFFVCNIEGLILARQPKLWIHGHTHGPLDYHLGETRIVCNPMGYPHEGVKDFDEAKILEV